MLTRSHANDLNKRIPPTRTRTFKRAAISVNYNEAARLPIKQNCVPEAKQKLDTLIKIAPSSDGAVIAKEILAMLMK